MTTTTSLLLAMVIAWLGAAAQAETFPNRADASVVVSDIPDSRGLAVDMGDAASRRGVHLARVTVDARGDRTLQAPPSAPPVESGPVEPVGIPGVHAEPWSDATSLRGKWVAWGDPDQLRHLYTDLHELGIDVSVVERADVGPRDLAASHAVLSSAQWVLGAAVLAAAALVASEATRRVAVAQACGGSRAAAWWRLVGLVLMWMVGTLAVVLLVVLAHPATRPVVGSSVRDSVLGLLVWSALGVFVAAVLGLAAGFQWEVPLLSRLRGRRPLFVIGLAASLAATVAMGLLPAAGGRMIQAEADKQQLVENLAVWDRMPQLASPKQYGASDNESPEVGHRFQKAFAQVEKEVPLFLNVGSRSCDFAVDGRGCLIVNQEYLRHVQPSVDLQGDGPWLMAPRGGGDEKAVRASVADWMAFQARLTCGEYGKPEGCVEVPQVRSERTPGDVEEWPVLRQGDAVEASGGDAEDPWVLVVGRDRDWLSGNFLSAAMSRSELMFVGEPRKVEAVLASSPVADRVSPAVDPQQTVEEVRAELSRQGQRDAISMAVLAVIELTALVAAVQAITRARRRRLFVGFVTGRHPLRRHAVVALAVAGMTGVGTLVALSRGVLEAPGGGWLLIGQVLVVTVVVATTALVVERGLNTSVLKEG
ncbi:hypothetical protein [Kytococcus sp. Marseille-QA3725]